MVQCRMHAMVQCRMHAVIQCDGSMQDACNGSMQDACSDSMQWFNAGCMHWLNAGCSMLRVGQNRIYAPYMTVYLVFSLPKLPFVHRIFMVLANPKYAALAAFGYTVGLAMQRECMLKW